MNNDMLRSVSGGLHSNNVAKPELNAVQAKFRVLGKILSQSKVVGYLVMSEQTYNVKPFSVNQTLALIESFPFSNIKIENGEMVNTECALERLPSYNLDLRPFDPSGVTILGELCFNNKRTGFKIITNNGKFLNIKEQELIDSVNKGTIKLNNAKIQNHGGKEVITGIKKKFKVISIQTGVSKASKDSDKEIARENRRQRHLEKLGERYYFEILSRGLLGKRKLCTSNMFTSYTTESGKRVYELDFEKELRIMISEYLGVYIDDGVLVTEHITPQDINNLLKLKELLKEVPQSVRKNAKVNFFSDLDLGDQKTILTLVGLLPERALKSTKQCTSKDSTFIFGLALVALYLKLGEKFEPRIYKVLSERVPLSRPLSNVYMNNIVSLGLFPKTVNGLYRVYRRLMESRGYIKKGDSKDNSEALPSGLKPFKTTRFMTNQEVAQLGYIFSPEYDGKKFRTDTGSTYTLCYIGNLIKSREYYSETVWYTRYESLANSFGDLMAIAHMDRLIEEISRAKLNNRKEMLIGSLNIEDLKVAFETIAIVASLYGSPAIQYYFNVLKYNNIDELVTIPSVGNLLFPMKDELALYYESGFNVFYSDNGCDYTYTDYRGRKIKSKVRYKAKRLIESEVINYRSLGATKVIHHNYIENILAGIVCTLGSSDCTMENVQKVIGNLRFAKQIRQI